MDKPTPIRSDTRNWSSGRVRLALIGVPNHPEKNYIILEKDFFGKTQNAPQRFLLRAHDWENLKRLIEGNDEGSWKADLKWEPTATDEQVAAMINDKPELVEVVLRSSNLANFGSASLEALDRLAARVYELKREQLDVIFKSLAESSQQAIEGFSNLLRDLRLNQVSLLSTLVYQKLKTIDLLERIIRDPTQHERAVHQLFDVNPWLLGPRYEIVQSDRPLTDYLSENVAEDPETKRRPDFIAKRVPYANMIFIVELKRPGIKLQASHVGQVLSYKALIQNHSPNAEKIECFLFGYEKSSSFVESNDVDIMTYGELVASLREEYAEYSKLLEAGGQEEVEFDEPTAPSEEEPDETFYDPDFSS